MTGTSIVSRLAILPNHWPVLWRPALPLQRPDLHALWQQRNSLPVPVTESALAMRYLDLLGPLAWQHFPERDLRRNWGQPAVPYAAFAAACLIKLNEARVSMADLQAFLVDNPLLIWLAGFPLAPSSHQPHGFDAQASLPTERHLTRLLRTMPNQALQFLLADSVRLILAELAARHLEPPQCIAVDSNHHADDPAASAAVPLVQKGKAGPRFFSPDGLPLCDAGLAMPLQFTFTDRTSCMVEHERGKYVCPLRFPQFSASTCPIQHKNWAKAGCTAMMPTSIGARLRYTLDRHSEAYKQVYNQRTAIERINSQAVALGIERPHIRNGAAIANLNTLIYTLINLRFFQRLRHNQALTT